MGSRKGDAQIFGDGGNGKELVHASKVAKRDGDSTADYADDGYGYVSYDGSGSGFSGGSRSRKGGEQMVKMVAGAAAAHDQSDYLLAGSAGGPGESASTLQTVAKVARRDEKGVAPARTLRVSGACAKQSTLNTDFLVQGVTADNRTFYQSEDGTRYLYFDKHCDGKDGTPARWIFDSSKPSTTAASDLDGDGVCRFSGVIDSAGLLPPAHAVWRLSCAGGWTDITLSLKVPPYAGWRICPEGAFCQGDGCSANTSTPRDRWDPDKVSVLHLCVILMHAHIFQYQPFPPTSSPPPPPFSSPFPSTFSASPSSPIMLARIACTAHCHTRQLCNLLCL